MMCYFFFHEKEKTNLLKNNHAPKHKEYFEGANNNKQ